MSTKFVHGDPVKSCADHSRTGKVVGVNGDRIGVKLDSAPDELSKTYLASGWQHLADSTEEISEEEKPEILPTPTNPMAVARAILDEFTADDGLLITRRWRGGWMQWERTHWAEIEGTLAEKRLYTRLEHAVYIDQTKNGPEIKKWAPNRHKVQDLLAALTSITHLPEDVNPPVWLERDGTPSSESSIALPANEFVACRNGLLHVGTRVAGALTPRYFNRVSVPFDYDPAAPAPRKWLEFLAQLWPGDPDAIAALQEWFGYVLSGRTDLHKIFLMVGPTRSGKGTIARVLSAMIGRGNMAGPTLASLGTNFGLQPLLGKPLAIVSDARLSGTANIGVVVERLLSISGEDTLTIDRKYRDQWTGQLPTRFLILSNELPRFGDASGAVAARFIITTMHNSFLGRENPRLTAELMPELPGILLWALDGLDRLTERKTFTEPASSRDAITALQDLVSPVAAFVRDRCDVKFGETLVGDLYGMWRSWCEGNGHKVTTAQVFGRDLRTVVPHIKVVQHDSDSAGAGGGPRDRDRYYSGIVLRKGAES